MLPRNHPDRIRIAFDYRRLVANASLLIPARLALRLGLPQLVDRRMDLGNARGGPTRGTRCSHWSLPRWLAVTASTTPVR